MAHLSTNGSIRPQPPLYQGMLQDPNCPVLVAEVAAFLTSKGIPTPPEMRALTSDVLPTDADPESSQGQSAMPVQRENAEQRQDRRLARFLALGGLMKRIPGAWNVDTLKGKRGALAELVAEEKAAGRARSDRKDISADLSAAVERQKTTGNLDS
jgi:hypothetical protein